MMRPGLVELEDNHILWSVLAFTWIVYIWDNYITLRQRHVYKTANKVPAEVSTIMDQETFDKARLYQLDKSNFGLVHGLFGEMQNALVLLLGGLPYLWELSARITSSYGYPASEYEITCSLLFAFIGAVISKILSLPWTIYSTFVIEERHGFNKQTALFFIKDQIKQFIVFQIISLLITSGLLYVIRVGGDYLFLYCWLFLFVVSLVMITVYPDYIAPLFDKFTPLPDGALKEKIESLAASIDFPLTKLYVVDGSTRSNHSNAYFYGFFKNKRIVLFDTLLQDFTLPNDSEKVEGADDELKRDDAGDDDKKESDKPTKSKKTGCTDDEVVAVLSHELGHWYLNHVLKNFVIGQVNVFICFLGFSLLIHYQQLYSAFGFYDSQPMLIGLVVIFSYIFAPYNEVVGVMTTMLSRRFEFQADEFGRKLGRSKLLQSALVKLQKDNLGFPVVDWLYSAWTYSHPPVLERIQALKKSD